MDDCKFLPESFAESHVKYLLNDGDIIFVMVGATRGKLAQIPASILPALMNQNMWRIVPSREDIDREYLFHHLRRSVVRLLQEDDDQARGFFKKSDFRDTYEDIPLLLENVATRFKRSSIFVSGAAAEFGAWKPDDADSFLYDLGVSLSAEKNRIITGSGTLLIIWASKSAMTEKRGDRQYGRERIGLIFQSMILLL